MGIPSESDYVRRCRRTGLAAPDELAADWNFYMAYRPVSASRRFCKAFAKREAGNLEAPPGVPQAPARADAELAWSFAQRA